MKTGIDTGDTVLHNPTGEKWIVAYVRGGDVVPCGWPLTLAKLVDCELIEKATDGVRYELLQEMSNLQDQRGLFARNTLFVEAITAGSED